MTPQGPPTGFVDLRREYEAETIGPLIWALTVELAGMVGRRYRPAKYNQGASWDADSVEELAQETAVELLVGERQIEYIFTVARSTEDVRRLLTRSLKRALWRRRSATVVDRLIVRVRDMVSQPPFALQAVGTQRWITLADTPGDPRGLSDPELRAAAAAAHRVPRLVEREDAERASMVYAPGALRELLDAVIGVTGGVYESDLRRIFRALLTAWLPASLVSVESDDFADATANVQPADDGVDRQEMESAVQDLVESMTVDELTVFVYKTQGLSDRAVAERLGRSRPWVASRKQAVLSRADTTFARVPDPLRDEAAARLLELASDRLGEFLR